MHTGGEALLDIYCAKCTRCSSENRRGHSATHCPKQFGVWSEPTLAPTVLWIGAFRGLFHHNQSFLIRSPCRWLRGMTHSSDVRGLTH